MDHSRGFVRFMDVLAVERGEHGGCLSGSGPGPCTEVSGWPADAWRSQHGAALVNLPRPVSSCINARIFGLSARSSIAKPSGLVSVLKPKNEPKRGSTTSEPHQSNQHAF